MKINPKLTKTNTIWSGNVYAVNQQTNIGQALESGHLYAFEVKGLSSLYYEYIPFISNGANQSIQHTTYDGNTAVRWRIDMTSNTFNLSSNSLNMGSNTAITKLIRII